MGETNDLFEKIAGSIFYLVFGIVIALVIWGYAMPWLDQLVPLTEIESLFLILLSAGVGTAGIVLPFMCLVDIAKLFTD